jgi:outer membrane protein TolC
MRKNKAARFFSKLFAMAHAQRPAAFAAALFLASPAFAQLGPPAGGGQSSQAAQLPLSGRTSQSNGTVRATENPAPSTTATVNTENPNLQIQGAYSGSTPSTAKMPFNGKLGLRDAVLRGLSYNLGQTGATNAFRQAEGQMKDARSYLLPNLNGTVTENVQTTDLRALGFRFNFSGFTIPNVIGPFNYMDARAHVSQTIFDFTQLNNYRASKDAASANRYFAKDARDLIVLAVGGAYLQAIAAKARLNSEQAQLNSANAVYQQSLQQLQQGLIAKIEADQNQVQVLTHQQRLLSLQNDLSKQKINLARMIGLPANDQYVLTDDTASLPAPQLTIEQALQQAYDNRADLKAAEAQLHAAERVHAAARAERYPALSFNGDIGGIGTTPGQMATTFTATATLKIPIWQGGKTEGDVEQADATLKQRHAEYDDLKGQIEADVRSAYLDMQAATSQVDVAQRNLQVNKEALELTHQKVEAGVEDNVQYVQAQETVNNAEFDYINSVFAQNIARLSLARAMGRAEDAFPNLTKNP